MQPQDQPPPPSERRWVATTPDRRDSVTVVHDDDHWRLLDGEGVEHDLDTTDHPLIRLIADAARHGWPWLPGWSAPETGFHDPAIYLHLDALGFAVDGPRPPELDAPTPTDGTIVG